MWGKLICWIFLMLVLGLNTSWSQKQSYTFVSLDFMAGISEYNHPDLSTYLKDGFQGFDIQYTWQSKNADSWVSMYNYPAYGFGYTKSNLGAPDIVGNPNAIYAFIDLQINPKRPGQKHRLYFTPAMGLGFGLNPYDRETNPMNILTSTKQALFVRLSLSGALQIHPYWDLSYGVVCTHISNGRTRQPNQGINTVGLKAGVKYHLKGRTDYPERKKATKLREHSINITEAIGFVQLWDDIGSKETQFVNIVRLEYRHKFNIKNGITAGLDWFYDTSIAENYPGDVSHFGIHAGYDYMFWVLGIRTMLGTYLGDDKGKYPVFGRIELQYEISPTFQLQLGIKSDSGLQADWLEFGFSIRPFRWSKKT